MVMFLRPDGVSRVRGSLEYGRGSHGGAYEVRGQANADGRFALNAGRWIQRAWSGERPFDIEGRIIPDGRTIEARLPRCKIGELRATREAGSGETRRSEPKPLSKKAIAWADGVRQRIAEFRAGGDDSPKLWQPIQREITFRMPFGGSSQLSAELAEALDEARANIGAQILLARLAEETKTGGKAAISAAVRIANEVRYRRWWPMAEVDRVVSAARDRAVEIMRPELQALAALASDLPETLDGLIKARAALAPIEARKAAMTRAFRSADPTLLVEPLYERIAKIETSASVAAELREALRQARSGSDPIGATAELLRRALGPTPPASLAALVKQAEEHAVYAAIVIEDRSSTRHAGEPTAQAFALAVHDRARRLNNLIGSQEARCRRGRYANVLDATFCAPFLLLDTMGGLRARLTRVTKLGCEVEEPDVQYLCRINWDVRIHSAKGGLLAPDLTRKLIETVMPGGETQELRFRRLGPSGQQRWDITRINPPDPPIADEPPLTCPWGEFDAGGFCMSYGDFE